MDGVFMLQAKRFIGLLLILVCLVYVLTLFQDKEQLGNNLIRLHVVGSSDSYHDQVVKLQVRDAVISFLHENMAELSSVEEAKVYLQTHLREIEAVANQTLESLGEQTQAAVRFLREVFPTKDYETFSLPAGIYEALNITIGEGKGQNWWCVVFPSLCIQATSQQVEDVAAGAGLSGPLAETITGQTGYRVRFFFLELLGKIESLFY